MTPTKPFGIPTNVLSRSRSKASQPNLAKCLARGRRCRSQGRSATVAVLLPRAAFFSSKTLASFSRLAGFTQSVVTFGIAAGLEEGLAGKD